MGIIPKITLFLIIAIASFLRLYNIGEAAEFLGDQGRTGIVIYEALRDKTVPLVGPTVLTGEHLGPIWYYLIGPFFILSGFNPLGPAIGMALFGVVATALLYVLAKKLYGTVIGSIVALLWAVSPLIVHQDQVIWEPNLVPLFVILFLLGLKTRHYLLLWGACGVLIQLHTPNIIFIPIALGFTVWGFSKTAKRSILTGLLLFLLIQIPFLVYEVQHGFDDILGIAKVMSQPSIQSKTQLLASFIDYTSRVFFRVIPTGNQVAMIVLQIFIAAIILLTKRRFMVFLLGFYIVGIGAMARYQGLVHDHYLNFLLPLPFLFVGNALYVLRRRSLVGAVLVGMLLVVWHITKPQYFTEPRGDIARSRAVALAIETDADGPFSFTVISSPSYSDLHYRYFFLLAGRQPKDIRDRNYDTVYLICEAGSTCPKEQSAGTQWQYKKTLRVMSSQIFVFGRGKETGVQ